MVPWRGVDPLPRFQGSSLQSDRRSRLLCLGDDLVPRDWIEQSFPVYRTGVLPAGRHPGTCRPRGGGIRTPVSVVVGLYLLSYGVPAGPPAGLEPAPPTLVRPLGQLVAEDGVAPSHEGL